MNESMNTFRKGFTLIELLVVIVIIAVMSLMVLPNFATGSDGARLRTASRGVMQMVRYARTMAVLRQSPMELVISSGGELRVEPKGGGSAAAPSDADAAGEGGGDGGGKGYEMAEVGAAKTYEQVSFHVEIDERSLDEDERDAKLDSEEGVEKEGADPQAQTATVVRIPIESNGRCVPFVVKVRAGDEDSAGEMVVTVDRFCVAKITDGDK
jgi:prepilin-type N-terminal cleavage/methylation domain-containing protein